MRVLLAGTFALSCLALSSAASGCGGDDDTTLPPAQPPSSSGGTPDAYCTKMCTDSNEASSRVDGTTCICTGPGTVTSAACQNFCAGIQKTKATAVKSSGSEREDACKCD